MKYLTTLVDVPIEAYPFLRNIHFDGVKLCGTLCLPFSKQHMRLISCLRKLTRFGDLADDFMSFNSYELSSPYKFKTFESVDTYLKRNHVFFPDNLWRYYNICRFGKDIGFHVQLTHSERFESIRVWVSQTSKSSRFLWSEVSNDKLKLIEGIYQTIRGFLEISLNRVSNRLSRWFRNKFVNKLIDDPLSVLNECKKFAHYCEKSFFDSFWPIPELFRVFETLNKSYCKWGRYITRSLPHGEEPKVTDYVDRVSVRGSYDPNTLMKFNQYVYDWVKTIPNRPITFRPSSMSSLETTRKGGGQSGIYLDIIKYQAARLRLNLQSEADIWCRSNFFAESVSRTNLETNAFLTNRQTDYVLYPLTWTKEVTDMKTKMRKTLSGVTNEPISREWFVAHGRFHLLMSGCWNLIKEFPNNPISVLVLKERGGKYRIPTKSLVPVQVLGGVIRSQVNYLLETDPRIRESLDGGNFKIIEPRPNKFIRSQDLKLATDNYPFEVIKSMYYTLIKRGVFKDIPFVQDYIEWIYPERGRDIVKSITISSQIKLPIFKGENFVDPVYKNIFDHMPELYLRHGFTYDLFLRSKPGDVFKKDLDNGFLDKLNIYVREFTQEYKSFVTKNYEVIGTQLKGPCMGEPLSWPILPLVTCFGFDSTHDHGLLLTCGDDAAFSTDKQLSTLYDKTIEGLGAIVNKDKDYLHNSKYIFVERLYSDGKPAGAMPFAAAFSMPSLKQEQTYLTVGQSLKDLRKLHNVDYNSYMKILRATRFREEISLYNQVVISSSLPSPLGGLDFGNKVKIDHMVRRVAGYVSDYGIRELIELKSLGFKRKVLVPVSPNRTLIEKLVKPRFYTKPREDTDNGWKQPLCHYDGDWYSWNLSEAWDLKSQAIYGLAALSGSGPLELDLNRPTIINRKRRLDAVLKTYKPVSGDINLEELYHAAEEAMNPPLYGYMPTSSDHYPLVILSKYDLKSFKTFEVLSTEWWRGNKMHVMK